MPDLPQPRSTTPYPDAQTATAYLTRDELVQWKADFSKHFKELPRVIDGVHLEVFIFAIQYSYGNARGLIHPDNGYLGECEGGRNYYPLARVSPSYSQDMRFGPTCSPNLGAIVAAIKDSWARFTKG